jgi:hypothetical protein
MPAPSSLGCKNQYNDLKQGLVWLGISIAPKTDPLSSERVENMIRL